jgi:diguanylate cyclase (GGDEF)-like protein/PAS domain S-box-containing protein
MREIDNSEAQFRSMSDASPLGIFVSDLQGNCTYTNAAYQNISGQTLQETLGSNWASAIHSEDRQRAIQEWANAVHTQEPFVTEVRFKRKDNSVIWTRLNAATIRDNRNNDIVKGYVQIVENIGDRKAIEVILRVAEDALYEQQERARVTLNSIGDGVLTINLAGRVSYLNQKAELMTGWQFRDAVGLPLENVFNVVNIITRKQAVTPIKKALKENRITKLPANSVLVHRNGAELPIEDSIAPIHNRDSSVIGAVIVFHDASDARALTEKMTYLAQHDVLTGLPNRALLTERVTRALGMAKRNKKQVALLFIDVDNFKQINDSLGHATGDLLLVSIAKRLKYLVRNTDTLCRQGGDEFVILLTSIEQFNDAAQVAEKVIAAFSTPHRINGHLFPVTLSIGASIYPDDSGDVDTMFKHADTAMYHAKNCGRNNYQFFHSDVKDYDVKKIVKER